MSRFWGFRASGGVRVVLALFLALVVVSPGAGQWYTPQSDRDLRFTWVVETLGPSQVRVLGVGMKLFRLGRVYRGKSR